MFLSLPHCALDIFATGKLINHGGEYGLEILANFYFYVPEKTIKLAKIKITKVGESLNGIAKQCLKLNVCKSVTRNILYDLLQGVSFIEMSVLGVNGSLDLKMVSAIERCRL